MQCLIPVFKSFGFRRDFPESPMNITKVSKYAQVKPCVNLLGYHLLACRAERTENKPLLLACSNNVNSSINSKT